MLLDCNKSAANLISHVARNYLRIPQLHDGYDAYMEHEFHYTRHVVGPDLQIELGRESVRGCADGRIGFFSVWLVLV